MAAFAQSAFPWVCIGVAVAVACAIIAHRIQK